jgi:hypothetical protein
MAYRHALCTLLLIWMGVASYQSLRSQQERTSSSDRVLVLLSALIQVHSRGYLVSKESYHALLDRRATGGPIFPRYDPDRQGDPRRPKAPGTAADALRSEAR